MLVSQDWLAQYTDLPDREQMTDRLTMSGLNFEGQQLVGDDCQIDLEVTSNRSDCLGHIGVAREISVLFDCGLRVPEIELKETGAPVNQACQVVIESADLCYRFTARLIRGVRVGPSPDWLVQRLATVGVESVNNIVDVSNYVMLECGQPLHTFDCDRLQDGQIVVRGPRDGETLQAINHTTYRLESGMCVIADGQRAVGLGGVMGGADTEVTDQTRNILVEAAWFNPLAIRNTARRLNLHSPASFRFERTIDPERIDWASRRCCQLIQQVAGGELAAGLIDVGRQPEPREQIRFRHARIGRVLGIGIPASESRRILGQLGFIITDSDEDGLTVQPPSWRRDVTREIDLVEEVGRIHGYHHVPDDVPVRMAATVRSHADRVVERIRHCLSASGLDEAMTASLVPEKWSQTFSPWTDSPPLQSSQPMLGVLERASHNTGPVQWLRRSVVPSLLEVFRINDHKQNQDINLFEMARVYLPEGDQLPREPQVLAIVCEYPFEQLKGIIESLLGYVAPRARLDTRHCDLELLDLTRSAGLLVDGQPFGWMGKVADPAREAFSIRREPCVAEVDVQRLVDLAVATVTHEEVSPYPAITREFNFVVNESVRWMDLATTVRENGGPCVESVSYRETFRDPQRDGPDMKRVLLAVVLRSSSQTLTREQAEQASTAIVTSCRESHGARLLG